MADAFVDTPDNDQIIRCVWLPDGHYSIGEAHKLTRHSPEEYFPEVIQTAKKSVILELTKFKFLGICGGHTDKN